MSFNFLSHNDKVDFLKKKFNNNNIKGDEKSSNFNPSQGFFKGFLINKLNDKKRKNRAKKNNSNCKFRLSHKKSLYSNTNNDTVNYTFPNRFTNSLGNNCENVADFHSNGTLSSFNHSFVSFETDSNKSFSDGSNNSNSNSSLGRTIDINKKKDSNFSTIGPNTCGNTRKEKKIRNKLIFKSRLLKKAKFVLVTASESYIPVAPMLTPTRSPHNITGELFLPPIEPLPLNYQANEELENNLKGLLNDLNLR